MLTDELTGEPLSHWKYRLTCGDKTVEGITDDSGHTKKIAAKEKSYVKIELLGVEAQA